MYLEPVELIEHLFEKRMYMEGGKPHKFIAPVLFYTGGGSVAVSGHAVMAVLHNHGLDAVFDAVLGISGGAIVAANHLSGTARAVRNVRMWENIVPQVIRYDEYGIPSVDLDPLADVLARTLDQAAIRAHPSHFHVGVTRRENGKHELVDAKPDIIRAVLASSAMPGLCPDSVAIDGIQYYDGGVSDPVPVEQIVDAHEPTHLLIVANFPETTFTGHTTLRERFVTWRLMRRRNVPHHIRRLVYRRHRLYRTVRDRLNGFPAVDWSIIWSPPQFADMLMNDPKRIRALARHSIRRARELIGRT